MKNIKIIENRGDIHDHVKSLWKTDIFKRSHDTKGFVHRVVDGFARLPRFFSDMTDARAERAHFSIWWSGVHERRYDKAACNDLYLLHEFAHGADMVWAAGLTPGVFKRKQGDNELYASVMTEIWAYFELPGLRDITFPHEIWADRFLTDPVCRAKFRHNPDALFREITLRRRNAMFRPAPGDALEAWIAAFRDQNKHWWDIWKDDYDRVETRMSKYAQEAVAGDRHGAMQRVLDWLMSDDAGYRDGIPFADHAYRFADIYWKDKDAKPMPKPEKIAA